MKTLKEQPIKIQFQVKFFIVQITHCHDIQKKKKTAEKSKKKKNHHKFYLLSPNKNIFFTRLIYTAHDMLYQYASPVTSLRSVLFFCLPLSSATHTPFPFIYNKKRVTNSAFNFLLLFAASFVVVRMKLHFKTCAMNVCKAMR